MRASRKFSNDPRVAALVVKLIWAFLSIVSPELYERALKGTRSPLSALVLNRLEGDNDFFHVGS
jgi:hypothetical protein